MSDDSITIEVDGRELQAEKGQMLIEVTDNNDIYIPRFCYHPKLTVAANCRMCLVDVEKAPKPLPACATPVMDGMVVKTRSERAISAQKSVMEFLLINHPLDCPICDQGGECELQDLAMGYGRDVSRYQESKRVVQDKNIGPLVQTEMTRCIHCTRCVRFGEEIAGLRELGATGRGEHMEIGTYIEKSMHSELSGNVIDVCPVGALTSKPFRFSARSWEMKTGKSIAPHDCIGSNVEVHFKGNTVKRIVPAENEAVNEVWLSDRDRFSYEALNAESRLTSPLLKQDGQWQAVDWPVALEFITARLHSVIEQNGADSLAGLISPSATVEEAYLYQKLLRALGSHNVDHRVRQQDFSRDQEMPRFPSLGCDIAELEQQQAFLLIGSNIRQQQPLLNLRIRKAVLKGASLSVLHEDNLDLNYSANTFIQSQNYIQELLSILKAVHEIKSSGGQLPDICRNVSVAEEHINSAKYLIDESNSLIIVGSMLCQHKNYADLLAIVNAIADASSSNIAVLSEGANSAGAWLAGAVPHRDAAGNSLQTPGLNSAEILAADIKALFLFHLDPEHDIACQDKLFNLAANTSITVAFSAYSSEALKQTADVILPIALFAENEGTFVNTEGRVQSFKQLVMAPGEARPAWRILRVLANNLGLEDFEYQTVEEIRAEFNFSGSQVVNRPKLDLSLPDSILETGHVSIRELPAYSIDPLVRRAEALNLRQQQETA